MVDAAAAPAEDVVVFDAHAEEPMLAFALSRLADATGGHTPIGVFRAVQRPVYDDLMREQLELAAATSGPADIAALLHSGDTWSIG